MKKLLAVTLMFAIIISTACMPAFANGARPYTTPKTFSDNSTDNISNIVYSDRELDELPPDRIELTNDEKLKLAQDYKDQYETEGDPADYTVLCFLNLSNGMKLVYVGVPDESTENMASAFVRLGKYGYHYAGKVVQLYQDGAYTTFSEAYNSGKIDDAILDEINEVMNFDVYDNTDEATPDEATPDEATPDEVTPEIDNEKLKMAQDYQAQYYTSGDPKKYTVLCLKTLSNGMKLVYVEVDEPYAWTYPPTQQYCWIGNFGYCYSTNKDVRLYKDGVYTKFSDAYYDGLIDDDILYEINEVMHFDVYDNTDEATPDDAIPDEATPEIDELPCETVKLTNDEKLKLAQDYKDQYDTEGDPADYTVLCFLNLSNGMKLVYVGLPDESTENMASAFVRLGKYGYHYAGKVVRLYQDGAYATFSEAYNSGEIDDDILDEINEVMHFDVYDNTDEPTVEIIKGDVDGDGYMSISDATCIQLYLAYLCDLTSEQKLAADVDGDGLVTISDATKIQMVLASLITM